MNKSVKTVIVLGSTGSVGTQALDVIKELGLDVVMLTGHKNIKLIAEQIKEFSPEIACVADCDTARELEKMIGNCTTKVIFGEEQMSDALEAHCADVTVHAIAGLAGLASALKASQTPTRLAMANKEAVICAGDMIFDNLRKSGGELVPVDSEHSAVFHCLAENRREGSSLAENVSKIILTASGGPFFGMTSEELERVTPERALAHPTWKMGPKITIDSATLMNKGFEIIEAVRLFGVEPERIEVVIHRQSIIHSMVEYIDNTVIAQLGLPDMRSAVRYALTFPGRAEVRSAGLDFASVGTLTFDRPDEKAFPLLNAGREAYKMGGTALCSLIAADERAVGEFIAGNIGFGDISRAVFAALDKVKVYGISEESIYEARREADEVCYEIIKNM